jgi:predicted enzyme related to lactoylglutathione lyase
MSTRLAHVVIDAQDPPALARFWADALGWRIMFEEPDEVEIEGGLDDVNLIFVPVPEPRTAKSRVHLDLATTEDEGQEAKVDRLLALGATRSDVGRPDNPWVVLADPEGNELCVLPHGYYVVDTGPIGAICITPEDRASLMAFWEAATGWSRTDRGLHPGKGPHLVFGGGTPAPKSAKNRVHIDVAPPPGGDQYDEADRLVSLGARRIDVGQRDVPWIVLADPEGNELCVLTPR